MLFMPMAIITDFDAVHYLPMHICRIFQTLKSHNNGYDTWAVLPVYLFILMFFGDLQILIEKVE